MLSLVLIAIFCSLGRSAADEIFTEQEKGVLHICAQEHKTDAGVAEHFRANAALPDENDEKSKCLFYCIPKKLSITDDTGKIDSTQVKDMILTRHPTLDEAIVKAIVKKCSKRPEKNVCDKWYNFTKCHWSAYLERKRRKEQKEQKTTVIIDLKKKIQARKEQRLNSRTTVPPSIKPEVAHDNRKFIPVVEQTQYVPTVEQTQYVPAVEQTQYVPTVEQSKFVPAVEQTQYMPTVEQSKFEPTVKQSKFVPVVEQTTQYTDEIPAKVPFVDFRAPQFNASHA